MSQFIGYSVDDEEEEAVPVATGPTRELCMSKLIQRTLGAGITVGLIDVQQRDDVEPAVFNELSQLLDTFFEARGQA